MNEAELSKALGAGPGGGGCVLRVKVVPGSSRSRVAGMLGDRLKVSVSAPPEGGKANAAVCALVAEALGVAVRGVVVSEGHSQPRKTLTVAGLTVEQAAQRLARG